MTKDELPEDMTQEQAEAFAKLVQTVDGPPVNCSRCGQMAEKAVWGLMAGKGTQRDVYLCRDCNVLSHSDHKRFFREGLPSWLGEGKSS